MNFKFKCYIQRIFSALPGGVKLNYFFQKNITKSLPRKNDDFLNKVNEGFQHYNNFINYNQLETIGNKYYEFGAGWDLIIPLLMSLLNLEVYCIDVNKLIISELIKDSIAKFESNKDVLPFKYSIKENIQKKHVLKQLEDIFNLHYFAPQDARKTSFSNENFDFISSTATMEHIPKNDILSILRECYRILKKGGILSMTIDYKDHWSYFDKTIPVYNFLKYSSNEWKKYNPSLLYQNRLRHSDYLELISRTDFEVVKELPCFPSDEDNKSLKLLTLDSEFLKYEFHDIAIKSSEIVLKK